MECVFAPALELGQSWYELADPEELRHVRALRLRPGERVALTNGQGLLGVAEFVGYGPRSATARFRLLGELPSGELPVPVGIALGILHERERLEFAVEKAVELGVREICLLWTRYTQPRAVRPERLRAKIRAAVKQSHRAWMPQLRGPMTLEECVQSVLPAYRQRVIADSSGDVPQPLKVEPTVLLIGPEGGWAAEELELVRCRAEAVWRLAPRRLRSETAVVLALGFLIAGWAEAVLAG